MERKMKNLVLLLVLFMLNTVCAQVSILGGPSSAFPFGTGTSYVGLHLGLEVPRDDAVSFYGKFTHQFSQVKPYINYDNNESDVFQTRMNYNIIEGGTRYYLGNGFDYGFAAYGGSTIKLIFNNVKSNYDMTQYAPTSVLNTNVKSSVFSVAFGLGGGVKYSFPRFGTIYCDLDLFYSLIQVESSQGVIANLYNNNQWRQLVFGCSIGYRKDLIW